MNPLKLFPLLFDEGDEGIHERGSERGEKPRCARTRTILIAGCLGGAFVITACKKAETANSQPPPAPSPTAAAAKPETPPPATSSELGIATWYDVSENSIPARRAPGELTAASDTLPMGCTVRVVNLSNDRSVLVRITDRGVHQAHAIDLCKEAASEIGLVGTGRTKVRIERLEAARQVAADLRP